MRPIVRALVAVAMAAVLLPACGRVHWPPRSSEAGCPSRSTSAATSTAQTDNQASNQASRSTSAAGAAAVQTDDQATSQSSDLATQSNGRRDKALEVTPTDTVDVDLNRTLGPVNRNLTGVVWNSGSEVAALGPVQPAEVRIDGDLGGRSKGPGQLDMAPLLDRIAKIRAVGAEPLVLLSYMPRWLGQARADAAGGKDPTRMGPYDLDVWQDLIEQVVRSAATAAEPAYRFEVWNEPDLGVFWQDTPEEFVAMALRTHAAVAKVKAETGLPLEVGGPASFIAPQNNMTGYLTAVADAGLALDFVTWHKYANFPFLGPDGPEGNLPDEIYQLLARRNPDATPLQFSAEIAEVKAHVEAAIAGHGLHPRYEIDEWNVSAGGYDVRHDTAEGASMVAGILVEMERAGLDGADFYRAVSGDHVGDWGLVYADGTPKPTWWVFRAWAQATGERLPTTGDDGPTGLWARATRDRGCVTVMLANFVATGAPARVVRVDLDGRLPSCRGRTDVTRSTLDAGSTSLATAEPLPLRHQSLDVAMEPQSVAVVQISCHG
jgi:hypothetical protein